MIGMGAIGAAPVGGGGEVFVPPARVAVAALVTRAGGRGGAVVPGAGLPARVAASAGGARPGRT